MLNTRRNMERRLGGSQQRNQGTSYDKKRNITKQHKIHNVMTWNATYNELRHGRKLLSKRGVNPRTNQTNNEKNKDNAAILAHTEQYKEINKNLIVYNNGEQHIYENIIPNYRHLLNMLLNNDNESYKREQRYKLMTLNVDTLNPPNFGNRNSNYYDKLHNIQLHTDKQTKDYCHIIALQETAEPNTIKYKERLQYEFPNHKLFTSNTG